MSPDDIRQEIELKVVNFLKEKATEGTMTEERSQQIAQRVLDTLTPGMSLEELYKKSRFSTIRARKYHSSSYRTSASTKTASLKLVTRP